MTIGVVAGINLVKLPVATSARRTSGSDRGVTLSLPMAPQRERCAEPYLIDEGFKESEPVFRNDDEAFLDRNPCARSASMSRRRAAKPFFLGGPALGVQNRMFRPDSRARCDGVGRLRSWVSTSAFKCGLMSEPCSAAAWRSTFG